MINAKMQESFIQVSKMILEKILNVKAFFDQYGENLKKDAAQTADSKRGP